MPWPPETCSADGAVTAVGISLIVAVVVGTLMLCGVICAFGFVGYFAAVGAGRA